MPRTLVLLSVFLLVGSTAKAQRDSVSPSTIVTVKQSLVPVLCVERDSGRVIHKVRKVGTGFFVSREGYFVTAEHVLTAVRNAKPELFPCTLAIYVPAEPWTSKLSEFHTKVFDVEMSACIASDREIDVAICKPKENPFNDIEVGRNLNFLRFASILPFSDGSPLAFSGFPLDFNSPLTSKAFLAGYYPANQRLVLNSNNWPGASGGPVYDVLGRVVGVVVERGTEERLGLTYAVAADAVIKFLRDQNIQVDQRTEKRRTSSRQRRS